MSEDKVQPSDSIGILNSNESKTTSLLDGRYHLYVPEEFTLMDEAAKAIKYPMGNRPAIVYTNKSGSINLAVNYTQNPANQDQLPSLMESIASQFRNVPEIKWKRREIVKINSRDFILMEFETPALNGEEIYNLMFMTDLEGRLLISSFNCKVSESSDWEDQVKQILSSASVKE